MASVEECRAAVRQLAGRFGEIDPDIRENHILERTLSCHLSDLDVTFYGRIHSGGIDGIHEGTDEDAQISLTMSSDDLIALVNEELDLPRSLLTGRVRLAAGFSDLLRLRKLL